MKLKAWTAWVYKNVWSASMSMNHQKDKQNKNISRVLICCVCLFGGLLTLWLSRHVFKPSRPWLQAPELLTLGYFSLHKGLQPRYNLRRICLGRIVLLLPNTLPRLWQTRLKVVNGHHCDYIEWTYFGLQLQTVGALPAFWKDRGLSALLWMVIKN